MLTGVSSVIVAVARRVLELLFSETVYVITYVLSLRQPILKAFTTRLDKLSRKMCNPAADDFLEHIR